MQGILRMDSSPEGPEHGRAVSPRKVRAPGVRGAQVSEDSCPASAGTRCRRADGGEA